MLRGMVVFAILFSAIAMRFRLEYNHVFFSKVDFFILCIVNNVIPVGKAFIEPFYFIFRRLYPLLILRFLFGVFRFNVRDFLLNFRNFRGVGGLGIRFVRYGFQNGFFYAVFVELHHYKQIAIGLGRVLTRAGILRQRTETKNVLYALPHINGNFTIGRNERDLLCTHRSRRQGQQAKSPRQQVHLRVCINFPISGFFKRLAERLGFSAYVHDFQIVQSLRQSSQRGVVYRFRIFNLNRFFLAVFLRNKNLVQLPGRVGLVVKRKLHTAAVNKRRTFRIHL